MVGSMNRPGDQSNIIYPFNIQRQKHIQHRSFTKILHHPSTCLSNTFLVVIKTLTEDLFSFERNLYTPIIICTPLLLKSGAALLRWWFPGVMEGLRWENCALQCTVVLTSYNTAPHNRYQPHPAEPEQYTKCSNRFFDLLKMGIMMPETCWYRS